MEVFKLKNGHLVRANKIEGRKGDKNEKAIQKLIENNLPTIFPELELLASEYSTGSSRFDSVAYDKDSNSFVIIEYKNVKQKGALEQARSYQKQLKNKTGEFVTLYYKVKKKLPDHGIDSDKSRVIVIAPEFTEHQKDESQIELCEITRYGKETILFNKIGNNKRSGTAGHVGQDTAREHTLLSAAEMILREECRPLHYKVITEMIMERNLVQTTGLKPWNSLRSKISVDMARDGSVFTAPARGMIGLKPQNRPEPPDPLSNNKYLSAAVKILNESGKPLHYKEITRRAIERGLLNATGLTPMESMGSRIYMNIKKNPNSLFKKTGKGTFDLRSRSRRV